jgi:hypothetical protein
LNRKITGVNGPERVFRKKKKKRRKKERKKEKAGIWLLYVYIYI